MCSPDMQLTWSCQGQLKPRMTVSGFTAMILYEPSHIPDCVQIEEQSPASERAGRSHWVTSPDRKPIWAARGGDGSQTRPHPHTSLPYFLHSKVLSLFQAHFSHL